MLCRRMQGITTETLLAVLGSSIFVCRARGQAFSNRHVIAREDHVRQGSGSGGLGPASHRLELVVPRVMNRTACREWRGASLTAIQRKTAPSTAHFSAVTRAAHIAFGCRRIEGQVQGVSTPAPSKGCQSRKLDRRRGVRSTHSDPYSAPAYL